MKHILIVDDSPVIRKVARRILESLRFEIAEAESARQGLDACAETMPDAIFVDGKMAEMDGAQFARAVRAMPGGDTPRVVLVMTEVDVAQTARARHYGADDILLKPFAREIMTAKIDELGVMAA